MQSLPSTTHTIVFPRGLVERLVHFLSASERVLEQIKNQVAQVRGFLISLGGPRSTAVKILDEALTKIRYLQDTLTPVLEDVLVTTGDQII